MAVVLLVAKICVHLLYGFSSVKLLGLYASGARFRPVGYEIDLVYLATLLMLAVQGPGPFALDNELQGRRIHFAESEKEGPRAFRPLIGQTVQKIGHIVCKDDSAPRTSDLVGAVAVHTDASTTPFDVETTVLVRPRKAIKRF